MFTARYGLDIYIIQGPAHVRSAMGKLAQGQSFFRVVLFLAVSTIPPLLLSVRLAARKQTVLALIPGQHWTEKYFHITFVMGVRNSIKRGNSTAHNISSPEHQQIARHMDVSFGTDIKRNGPKTNLTNQNTMQNVCVVIIKKGTAVPLQAWSGPEGSRMLRFPDFMTTAQDGGKVVSLTHRPPLPPGNTLVLISVRG